MSSSNKELEVKFYLINQDEFLKKLNGLGAVLLQPRTYERNLRFDTPSGNLTKSEQLLRLRRDRANWLTYKGPSKVKDGVSARTEIEFTVGDYENAQAFLEALGFQVILIYEKFRTVYQLKDTIITLDEMPFGLFAEIEGKDGATIQSVCNQIGLIWEYRTLFSYAELFQIAIKNLKKPFRDLTFDNFSDIQIVARDLEMVPADTA